MPKLRMIFCRGWTFNGCIHRDPLLLLVWRKIFPFNWRSALSMPSRADCIFFSIGSTKNRTNGPFTRGTMKVLLWFSSFAHPAWYPSAISCIRLAKWGLQRDFDVVSYILPLNFGQRLVLLLTIPADQCWANSCDFCRGWKSQTFIHRHGVWLKSCAYIWRSALSLPSRLGI